MKKILIHIICAVAVVGLFSACSSGNKFASSFGKRKYIKGYYMDMPSNAPNIATVNGVKKTIGRSILTQSINPLEKIASAFEVMKFIKACSVHLSSKAISTNKVLVKRGAFLEKAPPSVNTIQVDGGRHSSEGSSSSGSPYSIASFVILVVAIVGTILGLFAVLGSTAVSALAFIYVFYLAFIADIVAVVLAIIGLHHHEEAYGFAIAVLIPNGILVLLFLIGILTSFSHI